jgi:hypothetical protein
VGQVEGQANAPFRRRANQSQAVDKPDQMSGLSLLWMPSQSTKAKKRRGERKRGSTVPPKIVCTAHGATSMLACCEGCEGGSGTHCRCCTCGGVAGRRFLPPVSSSLSMSASCRRPTGRERPPLPSPLLRPMVQLEGVAHAPDAYHVRPEGPRLSSTPVACFHMIRPRVPRRSRRRPDR